MAFEIKFWGVRGSIACPLRTHMLFGGNTSCVSVNVADELVIFDAGTGINSLGNHLLKNHVNHGTICISHTHWDHINGFPFFVPAFIKDNSFRIMAGHAHEQGGIRNVMNGQMTQPFFPVPLGAMQANLEFEDFYAGDHFSLGQKVNVRTAPLNHPGGSTGYRVEHGGKSMCYVTDTEHIPDELDENILELIAGADLVIYDSTYTDSEFPAKVGWGHSTWRQGLKLCLEAEVKSLAIFHHDPTHDDEFMKQVENEARQEWSGAFVARESMVINLL